MLAGEEFERTLLRLVAGLHQALVRLLARRRLLAAHDLAALVADQILARQATLGVVGRAVEDLGLAADRTAATRLIRRGTIYTGLRGLVHAHSSVHGFLTEQQIFFGDGQGDSASTARRNDSVLQPFLHLRFHRFWI